MRNNFHKFNFMKKNKFITPFDHFLERFPEIWNFFKDNLTFLTVLVTMVGSLNQVLTLYLLNPNLIAYFSLTQGILEGVIFLVFSVVLTALYISITSELLFIGIRESYYYRIYLYVICNLLAIVIAIIIFNMGFGFIGLPLVLPLMTGAVTLLGSKDEELIQVPVETAKPLRKQSDRKIDFYLVVFYFIIIFGTFRYCYGKVQTATSDKILNKHITEQKVNTSIHPNDFKVIFINVDYIILQSTITESYLILKQTDVFEQIRMDK